MARNADENLSMPALVRGIVSDVRDLFREELALARVEVRAELRRARSAAIQIGVGAAALALGALLLLIGLAQAIASWLEWPAWAGYGLLALMLIVAGVVAEVAARRTVKLINGPQQTLETMKENVKWIATRTTSSEK